MIRLFFRHGVEPENAGVALRFRRLFKEWCTKSATPMRAIPIFDRERVAGPATGIVAGLGALG